MELELKHSSTTRALKHYISFINPSIPSRIFSATNCSWHRNDRSQTLFVRLGPFILSFFPSHRDHERKKSELQFDGWCQSMAGGGPLAKRMCTQFMRITGYGSSIGRRKNELVLCIGQYVRSATACVFLSRISWKHHWSLVTLVLVIRRATYSVSYVGLTLRGALRETIDVLDYFDFSFINKSHKFGACCV